MELGEMKLVRQAFVQLGFVVPLGCPPKNANGPDLYVAKGNRAYSVEIKKARVTRRGSLQVPPVEPNRREDDLIAILIPRGYVLIEPLSDHLKCCTKKGYRTLTELL